MDKETIIEQIFFSYEQLGSDHTNKMPDHTIFKNHTHMILLQPLQG